MDARGQDQDCGNIGEWMEGFVRGSTGDERIKWPQALKQKPSQSHTVGSTQEVTNFTR
jgi:hypothetical protein